MPKFLGREEIYRIIQRELPEGVYPDGAPSSFYSTADSDATASVFFGLSQNLERIYENYYPQTADEKEIDHEILHFGKQLDSALTLQQRRDRVLAKIRTRRRCTPGDILQTVYTVIDSSIFVELVEWGCSGGGWILDESLLEISTILIGPNPFLVTGPDLCGLSASGFGLTEEELLEMREDAYTYEVRIYDYTLTAEEFAELDAALLDAEPARSRHIILDGLDPIDSLGGGS